MNIICPYRDCQQRIGVTPEDAGTQADCPACSRPLKVPELSAFPPEEVVNMGIDVRFRIRQETSLIEGPSVLERPDFHRPPDPAPPEESVAGCPECKKTLDPRAQQVVRQLVELRQTGAKVNGLRIDCATCGREVRFHDVLWIDKAGAGDFDSPNGSRTPRATFKPPQTRREIARELSDSGVTAASRGDLHLARSNWVKAAEADHAWSVPFFNLAMLALDSGDPQEASDFIELAEKRASRGTSAGDSKVLKQLPALRSRLQKLNLADRR